MSSEYAKEWVAKAEADRVAARRALADSRKRSDQAEIACFHAQQCAEKYLKAILAHHRRPVPRVHQLEALGTKLTPLGFPARRLKRLLGRLTQYAVEVRYPGASATVAEARKALSAMERVVGVARAILKPLQATGAPPAGLDSC